MTIGNVAISFDWDDRFNPSEGLLVAVLVRKDVHKELNNQKLKLWS